MTSDIQLEANRANAQKSTGPVSEAGKAAVRFNATRHGLTSHVACMTWEDRDAFNQFCAGIVGDLKPEGAIETQLAQSIAEDYWRLNRVRAIEENLFALGGLSGMPDPIDAEDPQIRMALSQAETFRADTRAFNLITLYEARINRNLHRNMDRLKQLQSDRRATETAARTQALEDLVAQNRDSEALPATHNGFVFSEAEIAAESKRQRWSDLLAEVEFMNANPITMPEITRAVVGEKNAA